MQNVPMFGLVHSARQKWCTAICGASLLLVSACGPDRTEVLEDDSPTVAIDGEFLVDRALTDSQARQAGLELVVFEKEVGFGLYRVTADGPNDLEAVHDRLVEVLGDEAADTRIEPNLSRSLATNDPLNVQQWNLSLLDIETAWQTTRGAGVTVAVLDSGVYTGGNDAPTFLLPGYDFIDDDADADDEHGHGTHVAGTIAQATDNGFGVAGVAPDVAVLPVRVLNENGNGSTFAIARGITWAVDNGADVINLSLGSNGGSAAEQQAVQYALDSGVVVVAASGNQGEAQPLFPAAYTGVISVGAVGGDAAVAPYSNQGVDLVAPGGRLAQDIDNDGIPDGILQETVVAPGETDFVFLQGTSMASPHVAASAALLLSAGADPADVPDLLTSSAFDLDAPGFDARSGAGLVDPVAALEALQTPTNPNPTPDPNDPADPNDPNDPNDPGVTPPPTGTFSMDDIDIDRFGSWVELEWTTDVPATSEVRFVGYGVVGTEDLTTDHHLTLQVDFWETYFIFLESTDASGATVQSDLEILLPFD